MDTVEMNVSEVNDGVDLGNKNFTPEKKNSQKIYKFEDHTDKSNQCEYELNTGDEYLLIYAQD